ncbi:MAG: hypothetical protein M3P22_02060 [bacterium]|nr:hypothetical protein [bacterium]
MLDFIYSAFDKIPTFVWLLLSAIVMARIAFKFWLHYIRQDFISGIDFVLLEIIPPRDVLRNPQAMELFFTNALYHFSQKGGKEEFWQGAVHFWFSLEIVSIEGQVHFYIQTPTRLKGLIETQMYAQYPQAQVRVADDYTLAVDTINEKSAWNMWGCEFVLAKPEVYPIKTYIDYKLDKDPDEEQKIDPISPLIELFGSLGKGEQYWFQMVVRPALVKHHTHGTWFGHHDWVQEGEIELDKIAKPYTKIEVLPSGQVLKSGRTPDHLKPLLDGVTKKIQKVGFDTGIRACYVAKKENYSMNSRRNLRLILRQYANPFLNSFNRVNSTQADALGGNFLPGWFLLSSQQVMTLADRMLHEYRERKFFHLPLRHALVSILPWPISPFVFMKYFHPHTFVLNVEELATIWHFPGQILKVPTLERIESKEAAPPTNLPI